jgi:hypothetical protein
MKSSLARLASIQRPPVLPLSTVVSANYGAEYLLDDVKIRHDGRKIRRQIGRRLLWMALCWWSRRFDDAVTNR